MRLAMAGEALALCIRGEACNEGVVLAGGGASIVIARIGSYL